MKDFTTFVEAMQKAGKLRKRGAKNGKKDQGLLDKAHDTLAELADGVHCVNKADQPPTGSQQSLPTDDGKQTEESGMGPIGLKVNKVGARHSIETMMNLKAAHDALVKCGAACGK